MRFDGIKVIRCQDCNHFFSIFDSEPTISIYNDDYFLKDHKNWFENPNFELFSVVQETILEHKSKDASVIDFGCGKGDFLKYLKSNGFKNLTGVDLAENKDNLINYIKKDIWELNPNKTFDAVTSFAVIEHFEKTDTFLNKLDSFVKRGGLLVIMTVDSQSILYNLAKLLYKVHIIFPAKRLFERHHINHYNRKSLLKLIDKYNYEIVSHKNMNFPYKAVDVPKSLFSPVIKICIYIIFLFTKLFKTGMQQVIILKKKTASSD
jgi:2-polyprenyl-3-methyl-5-hydroxy-6-metoxy-1,4-benzoquinol methylase